MAALVDIHATGLLPSELCGPPHEVISLTRWGERDDLAVAWCCTLLWLAPGADDHPANIAPRLVASCLALGAEATTGAKALFAWHAETEPRDLRGNPEAASAGDEDEEEEGPDPYALLSLLLLCAATDPADRCVDALARRTLASLGGAGALHWGINSSEALWRALASRLLGPARRGYPAASALLERLGL